MYSLFGTVNELVLVGALVAGLHAAILPQHLRVLVKLLQDKSRSIKDTMAAQNNQHHTKQLGLQKKIQLQ